jgi:hypothetical protein
MEIILEEKAEERDPETDGDLPALESPRRK